MMQRAYLLNIYYAFIFDVSISKLTILQVKFKMYVDLQAQNTHTF